MTVATEEGKWIFRSARNKFTEFKDINLLKLKIFCSKKSKEHF